MWGYDQSYSAFGNDNEQLKQRGYIGAGEEVTYQGGRFTEAPSATQALFGIFNYAIDFWRWSAYYWYIYELVSFQDYA